MSAQLPGAMPSAARDRVVNRAVHSPHHPERRPQTPRPLRLGPRLFIAQTQPGFESIAWSEIEARAPFAREWARRQVGDRAGLSIFTTATPHPLRSLRCAEDVLALAGYRHGLSSQSAGLDQIRSASREAPFVEEALNARVVFQPAARAGRRLRFRVIARQVGEHEFRRVDLKRVVELGITERRDHTWRLDEEAADVEFWATQIGGELLLAIRLSDERMRHRDYKIAHRPGSLRPAVAAAMAWLSDPRDDDIILDPFCGVGTLLIERAHLGRYRNLIGSDRDPGAIRAARENIGPRFKPVELHDDWDAGALPLADASVTKITANLPWGIKHGSHAVNRRRYGDWLAEMNRVLAADGKMVLLTAEWRLMRDLTERGALAVEKMSRVTVLGAPAALYVCKKTCPSPLRPR